MAITLYTGPPGSGKSHALVAEVLVPGVMAGRRVLTNIDGVSPEKVDEFCAAAIEKAGGSADELGEVVTFDGDRMTEPGFFPTDAIPDTNTVVKAGDLLIVDEWRLYFPRRGRMVSKDGKRTIDDLEPFLRWHRHLVNERGVATDVVIASQAATDLHMDLRGLVSKSFKFRKLDTLGLPSHYVYRVYESAAQGKGETFHNGREKYRKEIFPLYASYSGAKGAAELQTDRRTSMFTPKLKVMIAAGVIFAVASGWYVFRWFTAPADKLATVQASGDAGVPGAPRAAAAVIVPWRIIGQVVGDDGVRVVVVNDAGVMRVLRPDQFSFDGDKPVSGFVDGQPARAEEFVQVDAALVEIGEGEQ